MSKILAISTGGLGDTVLFSPVLKALHKSYPEAQIELLVANSLAKEAYSYAKEVSRVAFANFNRLSPSYLKATALIPFALSAYLNGTYDKCYFATGLNPALAKIMKNSGIIHEIFCAPIVPAYPTDLDCNLELARRIDESASKNDIFIPETNEGEIEAKDILEKHNMSVETDNLVAVYPSTELSHRPRWALSNIIKVVKLIRNSGFKGKSVVVGSQREGQEWDTIDKDNIVDANLAGKLSILGSASLLKKCSLAIANDGGLMHVAAAVKSPLVAIMANTPLSYRPHGKNVKIIHSKHTCCNGLYPKRPSKCKNARCTEDITVKEVFHASKEILDKTLGGYRSHESQLRIDDYLN